MCDIKIQDIAHHTLYLLNPGITKLQYFIAIETNKVVMLFVSIRLLEQGDVFTKLMSGHQITGQQVFNGIVKRCSAHVILAGFHVEIK